MISYQQLLNDLQDEPALAPWLKLLPAQISTGLSIERFGDLPDWLEALESMPVPQATQLELSDRVAIGGEQDCDENTLQALRASLEKLIPWRKGPYFVHGIHIDTEWRSDWKWDRVLPHLAPLENRLVLDVGCGNGYHGWRMLGAGARRVIGIDPSPRFVVQFEMIRRLTGDFPMTVLPVGIEAVPENLRAFDTVFSMGVFYHRRSPMDHLRELKETLRPGGQLVLETLVIEGKVGELLVPEGRYAKMNNVWFLPSPDTMISWLKKNGFKNPRVVDICPTTNEEQRTTEWMRFQSLPDFLDQQNPTLTDEGHPAPIRAVFLAEA